MPVVSLPFDGCAAFPFDCLDGHTGDQITLASLDDVHALFNSWPKTGEKWQESQWVYAELAGIIPMLLDTKLQDVISRRQYCERFGVAPFEGGYDNQPEWWLTALNVVDNSEAQATKYLRRKNG